MEVRKIHDPSPYLHKVPADLSQFWVITVISNSARYKRRYELYWRFAEMCQDAGVKLITVECAFGHRPWMVTSSTNPYHLQIRTFEELWHKENMINLGIKHACRIAPGQVREVAWVDADCRPARTPRDWFEETWHQLQHYEFVQMWEWLQDLDHDHNPIGLSPSFMGNYIKYGTPYIIGKDAQNYPGGPKAWGSPGLAWAANTSALMNIGMLPEYTILGAGDWYLAHMLVSELNLDHLKHYSKGYRNSFLKIQDRCTRWIKHDVGMVQGLVYHDWHGKKINRGYNTREQILIKNRYNPEVDIKYDAQGLLQLETWSRRQIKIRDQIRAYFRARNEDQI